MIRNKIVFLMMAITNIFFAEDVTIQHKSKKESVGKLKEQLVQDLQDLLALSTHSIKDLTTLIDDIVMHVKQLAGQEDGMLYNSDKKKLEIYQQKVCQIKKLLQNLDGKCCLGDCV